MPQLEEVNPKPNKLWGTRPEMFENAPHEIIFVSVMICAQMLGSGQLGAMFVPLGLIAKDLQVSNPAQYSWFVAAYALTGGVFIIITGRIGIEILSFQISERVKQEGKHKRLKY